MGAVVLRTRGLTKYYATLGPVRRRSPLGRRSAQVTPGEGGGAHQMPARTRTRDGQIGIEDLTIELDRGEVYGFLGPNGAGKTTTIRLLLGLLKPTRGDAELFGMDAWSLGAEARTRVGYLPGDLAMYRNYRAREMLRFVARMRGGEGLDAIDGLAERLGLDLNRHIHDLSKGNKQKVGVVAAFMHHPDLLVLDEPTAGLDPVVHATFVELVGEAASRGAAVFLSSHVLSEVEQMADRVAIVDRGRLLVEEQVQVLKRRALRRIALDFDRALPPGALQGLDGVSDVSHQGGIVRVTMTGPMTRLLQRAAELGAVNVVTHEPDLEDIFFDYLRQGGDREHHESAAGN